MASDDRLARAFEVQAHYCRTMASPITLAIVEALPRALDRATATGRAVLDWPGDPIADALVLRLHGGLHALARAGDPGLARLFAGKAEATAAVDILREALSARDSVLLGWLDGPPQTNEAGRSAGLMTGLLHLAAACGRRVELLEIGSSAGLNLLIDRFAFDLGGTRVGPADAELTLAPAWSGPPPPATAVEIVSTRGVDIAPIDVIDPQQAKRLEAYVWADAPVRQDRLAAAIGMVRRHGVALDQGDAADWLEARLTEPQPAGVARVLVQSVVWQYLPDRSRQRIRAMMLAAAARATPERPLGWVMMEPEPDAPLPRFEIRVRSWPDMAATRVVALTHPHAEWIEALATPFTRADPA